MERLFSMSDETVARRPRGRRRLSARAGRVERQGRLHRLLHGRALHAAVRDSPATASTPRSTAGAASSTAPPPRSARPRRARRRRWSSPRSCRCPLLAAVGAEDQNPSPELAEQLRERARASGQRGASRRLRGRRPRVLRRLPAQLPARAGRAAVGADRAVPGPPSGLGAISGPSAAGRRSYSRGRAIRAGSAQASTEEVSMERKWWTLIAVSVAIFMLLLDITVVNVALPDIQRSLHSSFSDLQWVVERLLADAGRVPADVRLARRPVRPPARVRDRPGRLHGRLGGLRARGHAAGAEPRPRRAGHRRRDDVRDLARADRLGLPRAATAASPSASTAA